MTSTPDTLPTAPRIAAGPPATERDLQRAALRDLVALSTESATTEAEIDHRRHAALEAARDGLEKAEREIARRHAATRTLLLQRHEERAAQRDAQYESQRAALIAESEPKRQQIQVENDNLEQTIRKKIDHAVWLADSVLEVSHNQIKQEAKAARESVTTQLEAVDAMEKEASALIERYGVKRLAPAAEDGPDPIQGDPEAVLDGQREAMAAHLSDLKSLAVPPMLVGVKPYIAVILACIIGAVAGWFFARPELQMRTAAIGAGSAALIVVALGIVLRVASHRRVREIHASLRQTAEQARRAARLHLQSVAKLGEQRGAEAERRHDVEVQQTREKGAPVLDRIANNREAALSALKAEYGARLVELTSQRDQRRVEAEASQKSWLLELDQLRDRQINEARQRHAAETQSTERQYHDARAELDRRLTEGLAQTRKPIAANGGNGANGSNGHPLLQWTDPAWTSWIPPNRFAPSVRFGELGVDLKRIAGSAPRDGADQPVRLSLPEPFAVPASLAFPRQASLLIQADRDGRARALQMLQTVMVRLLTSLPPGRARFTIIDPVGLGQNFAGFMHLADYDDALIGGRIWTDADQIDQRLADLTDHMETVIQKYLRNEFETIDDYNAQAGELAEPYRFLVIADFPVGFESEAFRRLSSIAASGARCGVYTLIVRDLRMPLPRTHLDDLEYNSINLVQEGDHFVWRDEVFGQFPLHLDPPPPEELLTRIVHVVGKRAKEAKRVEVPFDGIAPTREQLWSGDCTEELRVPIGRMGATRLQNLRLGRGVAQHVLIAGKTGSGKSTLLHALVTNLAMWYSPDEVEFYLIDFKKGVEFKTYATHNLPHARAIAVESDREFGLSVLQRLDAELGRRGDLFRQAGVQDLPSYRRTPGAQKMPRTLLMIDEFQEFFTEDDRLAQEAGLLLDRLVRQGRAFGVHVLLGSQTIGGSSGLARSTIGQMGIRIALQTSDADSQLILGDGNSAARLLSRPGEAIYNDAGGLVEGNSPFQIAWLPDERRDEYLDRVNELAAASKIRQPAPVVFEGNAPGSIEKNSRLASLLQSNAAPGPVPLAWVGEPVAIKEPTAIAFRRQSGANLLLVGQQEESAMAILCAAMISLAAQQRTNAAQFLVLDGTPADSSLAGTLEKVAAAIPHETKRVEWRAVPEAIAELAQELEQRQAGDPSAVPSIYVMIYGLHRYRVLRKQEESFSFSPTDEEKKSDPGKQFADLLREGPALGIHIITWCDTPIALERTLDRGAMREFDNRLLFQMSANDSSNLIDSPAANKLGFYRALAYSEEQGVMEKFRPYGLPTAAWLANVMENFNRTK